MEFLNDYAKYVVAYNHYIDKYLPNKDESACKSEIAICDMLFNKFESKVLSRYDDEVADIIIDTLCTTDFVSKKVDMANNIVKYFNLIS